MSPLGPFPRGHELRPSRRERSVNTGADDRRAWGARRLVVCAVCRMQMSFWSPEPGFRRPGCLLGTRGSSCRGQRMWDLLALFLEVRFFSLFNILLF